MTNRYLTSITPDSFSGIVFAFEGISNSVTVLNGPTGCKFFHSSTADNQMIRQLSFDPLNYPRKWFFGQPRVPCTYLDTGDYVYGSKDKLRELFEYIKQSVKCEMVCIVNSPGAALIGDDLAGIAQSVFGDGDGGILTVVVETPGFSSDVCHGHETAMLEILKQIPQSEQSQDAQKETNKINLLGLSLQQRNVMGNIEELSRLLELIGCKVGCALGAGCSVNELQNLSTATLNVVIYPEYGLQTAKYLESKYNIPYIVGEPPIGFEASERFVNNICDALINTKNLGDSDEHSQCATCNIATTLDSTMALCSIEKARARAYAFISRMNSFSGLPKGVPYAVEGCCSELCAYLEFLTGYMGMLPVCVRVLNQDSNVWAEKLNRILAKYNAQDALEADLQTCGADLIFGSGNTISYMRLSDKKFCGIETALPTIGYYDVVPKTFMGAKGSLHLVEMVLNGMLF